MAQPADELGVGSFRSHPVNTPYSLDEGPGRHRIGLVALASDYTIERDFMNMRPSDDVAIFTTRIENTPDCTVATLRQMAPRITAATELLVPEGRLDAVAYACTSGSVVIASGSDVTYELLIHVMDAAREERDGDQVRRLFPDVILSGGGG